MNMPSSSRTILLVSLLPLLLAACTSGTRPCAGFGHPLADSWSTRLNEGDSALYVGLSGATATLTLSSREDTTPYEGSDRFGSEEVVCNMESERQYVIQDTDVAFNVTLSQIESLGDTLDDQLLSIFMSIDSPIGTTLDNVFILSIEDPINEYPAEFTNEVSSPVRPRSTRHIINYSTTQQTYPLAVEQQYGYVENISTTNPEAAISRVVFAQDGGLVQFERLDGEVFSKMDSNL